MKKAYRELQARIQSLPPLLYSECLAAIDQPIVALAERVINFDGPFATLRVEQAGFDPLLRFVINRAEAGDDLAIKTKIELLQRARHRWEPAPQTDYWTEFFTVNKAAWDSFHRTAAPWLISDPSVFDPEQCERDPNVDLELDNAVASSLSDFGFRRLARSFQSDILNEPLLIKWDKGTWSMTLALFLQMPHRCLFLSLGAPFSSGAGFFFGRTANVGPRLRAFFRALRIVFPDLLEAICQGMRAQDEWLAKQVGGAA